MVSTSCLNLYDPGADGLNDCDKKLSRAWTAPGILSELEVDSSCDCENFPIRMVIVGNFLPLHTRRDPMTGKFSFTWDEDSLLCQMKDGFSPETEVFYVGRLKVDVDPDEEDVIAQMLQNDFNCVPTFLSPALQEQFYHGFCKHHLWPLFHYMLPVSLEFGSRFDPSLYQAYTHANQKYAEAVSQAMNSMEDYIWIHDYHLMLLPTLLRKRLSKARICFFLHSPFPSSEIYRTFPARRDILLALLNADLIGFHTFDYARHFLSCCSRMLGLDYESKRGYIGIEYLGRTVSIKILPVGINLERIQSTLSLPSTITKVEHIMESYKGKKILLGVDDMDIFKGISLKLLAMELLLARYGRHRGDIVLVQIINPPRSVGKDITDARNEATSIANRINREFGLPGYDPIVLIEEDIPYYERLAYYAASDCCVLNAVRDGMNLIPYEYLVCRQGTTALLGKTGPPSSSSLVVSEFVGCSPSLSGARRVNPWDIDDVCEAMFEAIHTDDDQMQMRHRKHYEYISTHDLNYWVRSFEHDLRRTCEEHDSQRYFGLGFGLEYRVVSLSPSFRRLNPTTAISAYKRAHRRAIFLDYDGTIVSPSSVSKTPSRKVISILDSVCSDPSNTVFVISGRDQDSLDGFFSSCSSLGIAAEHGHFLRWNRDSGWESMNRISTNFEWKRIAEPIMRLYTEATDGSYIESKKTAMVWHHSDADHEFGAFQAKELLDHLESVLANEPVAVTRGKHIVEVKPQGVGKGFVMEKLLSVLAENGQHPDFVMCVGDDRSDEDMFESIDRVASGDLFPKPPVAFACTVGQKPSKARYYVDSSTEVISLLKAFGSGQPYQLLAMDRDYRVYEPLREEDRVAGYTSPVNDIVRPIEIKFPA